MMAAREAPAKARAARVLMVGTALDGRGGVAAVIAVWRRAGLFEREGVDYVATHREGSRRAKLAGALAGFGQTLAACLRRRPAVVHAHVASHGSFVRKSLLLLLARLAGCKTIFHLHGGGFRRYALEESGPLMRGWIRYTLRMSSVVIALSEGWAGFVHGLAPSAKVAVVPNAVPLPPPLDATLEQPGRILFLGRLEAAKGVDELLDAAARLVPVFPGLRLALGGAGDADGVRRRAAGLGIADHVELLGWVGPEGRDAQLARASVFCLPSHAEGLPMSLLEAMAAGKAVVASSVGGIPEVVRDGENGLLVPPRDAAQLAGALARVLGEGDLRARLGAQARTTIAQHYSTEVVCGQLSALYHELAGAG
jgi:glycosyltransferase involved in cell wall biosynthesis